MTQENFIAEYKALQAKKQEIEDRVAALKEEYIKSLPFKVGDCVRITGRSFYKTERAWIKKIQVRYNPNPYVGLDVNLVVVEPKKDGSPSKLKKDMYWHRLEDIEVLEEV